MNFLNPLLRLPVGSLRWGSFLAVTVALFLATLQIASDETGLPYRYWRRYINYLESQLRSMFIFIPGRTIGVGQLMAVFVVLVGKITFDLPLWGAFIVLIAIAPAAYIRYLRKERVTLIEDQLDNFILALANALKTTPSIGAAFNSCVAIVEDPIRQEVDLAIKEMKVGSSLDQALLHMASRVGSQALDSALSSILIGRQVGGNLPKVLESTANSLREMKRLDGVIRSKTADGRMQMWAIGAMPAVFVVSLSALWPGYFDPLTRDFTGYLIIAGISVCWVSAIVLARKVLAVDI